MPVNIDKCQCSKNWLLTKLNKDDEHQLLQCFLAFGEFSARGVNELCLLELQHVVLNQCDVRSSTILSLIKVYQGVHKVREIKVPDPVCGVSAVNVAVGDDIIQDLAVAAGPNVYIYRNLKPYFKFKLPISEPNIEERDAWHRAKEDDLTVMQLWTLLDNLRQRPVRLTSRSLRFLHLPSTQLVDFYEQYRGLPLEHQTVATCMEALHRQHASPDSAHCLVVGTEQSCIYVIDPTAFNLLTKIDTPDVPVHLCVTGSYDIQFSINAACRDGVVYQAKRGSSSMHCLFNPGSQIVAMVRSDKSIVVGCMDQTVKGYSFKGHPIWSVRHNALIITLTAIVLPGQNMYGYLVSLGDGTLRLYKEQHICDQILTWDQPANPSETTEYKYEQKANLSNLPMEAPSAGTLPTAWTPSKFPETVIACVFGRYDREAGALAVVTRSGTLLLLLAKRSAVFELTGVIPTSDHTTNELVSIEPPKKTQALTASVKQERANCAIMNRRSLTDLYTMKRLIAKAYLELLDTRLGPVSSAPSRWPLTMNAQIRGTGPRFTLFMELSQTGVASGCKERLSLVLKFDDTVYQVDKPYVPLPYIVPNIKYRYTCAIEAIRDTSISDTVQIFLLPSGSANPILSIFVKTPPCEAFTEFS